MKSGFGKNGGGGDRGFVMLNSYPTLPKCFLEKLEYICRSNKKYFWPNIQALEKNVAKMAIFILSHLLWPEMAKMFLKNFWRMF